MIKHTLATLLLISCIFLSCRTPEQKLQRLYAKYPHLQKIDTNYVYRDRIVNDTVVIAGDTIVLSNRDTIFETKELKVYVTKDSIRVIQKPIIVPIHDTIRDSFPVIKMNNIPVVHEKSVLPKWVLMLIACLFSAIVALMIVSKFK